MLDIYKNKKVLVTGGEGFKGTWLVKWLRILGADVLSYDIKSGLDILDNVSLNSCFLKFKPEIVFHLAAQPIVSLSYDAPIFTYNTNISGTINVLEACKITDSVKVIINVTTDKVYKNKNQIYGYRETDELEGHDPYSTSKVCSELITESYKKCFLQNKFVATARAGNVIGGGDWSKDRLVPDMVKSIIENKLFVVRNKNAKRPWQHVLDVTHGYLLLGANLLNEKREFEGAWNFGPEISNCVEVDYIIKCFQKRWIEFLVCYLTSESFHEFDVLKLDSTKSKELLNWTPYLNIDDSLFATVRWYQDYYSLNKDITEDQINSYWVELI